MVKMTFNAISGMHFSEFNNNNEDDFNPSDLIDEDESFDHS